MKKTVLFIFSFLFMVSLVWGQVIPDNWTGDTGIDTYQEPITIHGGTYSCRVDVNTGTQANCDFANDTTISVIAGNTYTFTFWAYTSEFVRITGVLDWVGASVTYSGQYVGPNTGGWSQFSYSNTVPAGATGVNLRIRFYDVSGFSAPETQYVDDFEFESPTGTPLTVTNGDMESWPTGNTIARAFTISNTTMDVVYVGSVTSVNPSDYNLTGTSSITFTGASIDGVDDKIVHLTGASSSMVGDTTLDNIDDTSTNLDFYAGIMPISNTNTNVAGGPIDNTHLATYQGIVSANDGYNNVWVSDASGSYNGVMVFDSSFDALVSVGDEILFAATRAIYNSLTELVSPILLSTISSGNDPYGPDVISGSDIDEILTADTNPGESWEGQLIEIQNVYVDSYADYYYRCTDDGGTTYFYIGDNVDYQLGVFSLTVGETYQEIVGVADWYNSGPYYRINPRDNDDQVLPVTLSDFSTAIIMNEFVQISWTTQSESSINVWNLYRETDESMGQILINSQPGTNTQQPNTYLFDDFEVEENITYYYYLEVIEYDGSSNMWGPISAILEGTSIPDLPTTSMLESNYPNPFNPSTTIKCDIKEGEEGELTIYNSRGQAIEKQILNAGEHIIEWDGTPYGSGVYLYKLETNSYTKTRKMIMIK